MYRANKNAISGGGRDEARAKNGRDFFAPLDTRIISAAIEIAVKGRLD